MGIISKTPQSGTQYEPSWELPRQRRRREFFQPLKRERIRRRAYKTREDARRDVFDYIEMFYIPKRKQARNGMLSPVEFER